MRPSPSHPEVTLDAAGGHHQLLPAWDPGPRAPPQGQCLHTVGQLQPQLGHTCSGASQASQAPGPLPLPGGCCALPQDPCPSRPGGALPSLRQLPFLSRSLPSGPAPPEATWYQRLSSQEGAASRRVGERRAAVATSLPRCVPAATYQPGRAERSGDRAGSTEGRAGVETRPGLTEVSAQSVVRARPWTLRCGPCPVSEPAVARGAHVPPATGVLLEVAGEGGAQGG